MFGNFINPVAKVIKRIDKTADVLKGLQALADRDILIGVPEAKSSRKSGDITNAELAFIHSEGSPARNIPPRPFLQPAIEANQDRIAELHRGLFKAALNGGAGRTEIELKKIGMYGQNIARDWFTNPSNHWPALRPATIARKGSDKPLIDTGQLRKSVTYVIRNRHA